MSNIQRTSNPLGNPMPPMPPRGPMPAPGMDNSMTAKEVTAILRRHIWLIIAFTIAGVIIGGASWYLLLRYAPKYTSRSAIKVEPPADVDPTSLTSPIPNKDIYYQFRSEKAAYMKQQNMLRDLLKRDDVRQTGWYKSFDSPNDRLEALEDDLRASPERDGTWVRLSMTAGNKADAKSILNEAISLFLQKQRDAASEDTTRRRGEMKDQRDEIKEEIQNLDDQLAAQRRGTSYNLAETNFRTFLDDKLEEIQTRRDELETRRSELESQIEILKRRAEGEYDQVVRERIEQDPTAATMRNRIAVLETQLAGLEARFGDDHRRVKEARDALKRARDDLAQRQAEIGNIVRYADLQNAQDRLTTMAVELETTERQVDDAVAEYKELADRRANYDRVLTDREEAQRRLEEINTVIQKLDAKLNDPKLSKVSQAFEATEPNEVSSPQLPIYVGGGFMLGLLAGVGLAFAIEMLNDLLRSPSDVAKHLRVPLLGMVSHADEEDGMEGVNLHHAVRQAPFSMMSENYRQLKTNLRLSESGGSHKTLMVTSCNVGCGKTSVATNLAYTLVAEGERVLLIDTNFRRPSIAKEFPQVAEGDGTHADKGLSNYLMGQAQWNDVIRASGVEFLDIVDSGPLPNNPSELLGGDKMRELLDQAKQSYDYVLIDGPALLVSDAKVLAWQADGTVVVFNATSTRKGEAQRALRELRNINADVAGTVLLGVKAMKGGYFHEIQRAYHQYQQVGLNAPA
ncbi:Tyrosine-protein kinase YwqD [Anaerohalosphaera lusitana]|uniref:Tyrosine-protein kinase YwqD n=1 Tax=Anaerohalosphaera lusitana TaxID=1936003 RepID=A0A1U9NP59_9BACT|nr:polysaccharide biosynthesis tyrosine autokinase [Anaerohalosphaera lusitana]AQT69701.1 Tyrosine-protein kinase YwqD [Anaerohalosphaera lusitana]